MPKCKHTVFQGRESWVSFVLTRVEREETANGTEGFIATTLPSAKNPRNFRIRLQKPVILLWRFSSLLFILSKNIHSS